MNYDVNQQQRFVSVEQALEKAREDILDILPSQMEMAEALAMSPMVAGLKLPEKRAVCIQFFANKYAQQGRPIPLSFMYILKKEGIEHKKEYTKPTFQRIEDIPKLFKWGIGVGEGPGGYFHAKQQ